MRLWTYSLVTIFEVCLTQSQASLPPCFEDGLTWYADDVLDLTVGAETVYNCQAECEKNIDCEAFTWNTPSHTHYPMLCTMFHTTSRQESCSGCISGPDSCTCSADYGCDITGDNVVDTVPGVDTELECMGLCYQERECELYTWFEEGNVYRHFCFLFKYCQSQDFDCNGCFSGPPVCESPTTWWPTDSPTEVTTDWWTTNLLTDGTTDWWTTNPSTDGTTDWWSTNPSTDSPTEVTTGWWTTNPLTAGTTDWWSTNPSTDGTTDWWTTRYPPTEVTTDWTTRYPPSEVTTDWMTRYPPTDATTDWRTSDW